MYAVRLVDTVHAPVVTKENNYYQTLTEPKNQRNRTRSRSRNENIPFEKARMRA